MQRHAVILVKHKNYVSYMWTADWYARTPQRANHLAIALLPENKQACMPGLPTNCIPPNATNATACVLFLNKIWFPGGCLAAVTLILNGALGAFKRKHQFMANTVMWHEANFGPVISD